MIREIWEIIKEWNRESWEIYVTQSIQTRHRYLKKKILNATTVNELKHIQDEITSYEEFVNDYPHIVSGVRYLKQLKVTWAETYVKAKNKKKER